MKYCKNELFDLVLSKNAIDYTIHNATPLVTLDFVGYLGILDAEKDKVLYLVDLKGNFILASGNKDRPKLPRRLQRKWMKWCIKNKFLEYVVEPFQEFNPAFNLPFDEKRA